MAIGELRRMRLKLWY